MKNLVHGLLRGLRVLAGHHAEYEDLLAYRDGELGRIGRWRVGTHLGRCKVCLREAELIEKDLRTFKKMDHLFYANDFLDLPKGLERLAQAIQGWEAQRLVDDEARPPGQTIGKAGLRQLATDLDLYLGDGARTAFLLKMRSGEKKHPDIVIEVESVLSDFIGPGAASAVTQRILSVEMSNGRSIQGSPAS